MCRTPTFSIMMPMQVELSDNGACETGFECTKNSSSSSICVIEIFFNEFLFENSKKKKKKKKIKLTNKIVTCIDYEQKIWKFLFEIFFKNFFL